MSFNLNFLLLPNLLILFVLSVPLYFSKLERLTILGLLLHFTQVK